MLCSTTQCGIALVYYSTILNLLIGLRIYKTFFNVLENSSQQLYERLSNNIHCHLLEVPSSEHGTSSDCLFCLFYRVKTTYTMMIMILMMSKEGSVGR